MLSYKKTFKLAIEHNTSVYKILGRGTRLTQDTKYISTKTIDKLCAALQCQPSHLMEYVPDNVE